MASNAMSKFIQRLRDTALLDKYSALTDGQLLDNFVHRRDEETLEALVRRHVPMVWGVCQRVLGDHHDAEDAFQATFLILVRKAASVHPRAKIGNWLYGVAYQTAIGARRIRAKRQARERNTAVMPEPVLREQDFCKDLLPLLDQEISRLPEKYRAAIVLCDLGGKTKSEAAKQLSVPEGTVASRVARARAILAQRLRSTRPDGALSTGATLALHAQNASFAAVPKSLTNETIKAAKLLAMGQDLAGIAVPGAVALSEGVLKVMFASKCKVLATALFAVLACASLVVGLAQSGWHGRQSEPEAAPMAMVQKDSIQPNQDKSPAQKDTFKPLPPKFVKVWRDAGAIVGWMRQEKLDAGYYFQFVEEENGAPGDLPAFGFSKDKLTEGILAKLPAPEVPFGLTLTMIDVTDAQLTGLARLKSLIALDLTKAGMTDSGMKELAGLTNLTHLYLYVCPKVTNRGLSELAALKNLRCLVFGGNSTTDEGLKALAGLRNLQTLFLMDANVSDQGLKELAEYASLESLHLHHTKVTIAGLKELAGMKSLRLLDMYGFRPADAEIDSGLKELAWLTTLRSLKLDSPHVTDAQLRGLAAIQSLQLLDLQCAMVTDVVFKELAQLKRLQSLNLSNTKVTGFGLKELAVLNGLQELRLNYTGVTDDSLKELTKLKNLSRLELIATQITDGGLKELANLQNLRRLDLGRGEVTEGAVEELRKAMPKCVITYH